MLILFSLHSIVAQTFSSQIILHFFVSILLITSHLLSVIQYWLYDSYIFIGYPIKTLILLDVQYAIMECCNMKGFLTYLILWILRNNQLTGVEIANELEKRRGTKPSPGTIYPALKELKEKGLILVDSKKTYTLTKKGEKELKTGCVVFCKMFYDMKDMFNCC